MDTLWCEHAMMLIPEKFILLEMCRNAEEISSNTFNIEQALKLFADKRQAAIYQRFFKTEAGGYGEGDHFLGVINPKVRLVVKEAWRHTSTEEATELVRNKWHEVRMCGLLILVEHFERAFKSGDRQAMRHICDLYTALHPYINNWDLVDLSVYKIVGCYELMTQDYALMDEWITPDHTLWQRRMAMVATWIHARNGFYEKLTERAEVLLTAHHDLLHKAAGWMLREMYKHDEQGRTTLETFLKAHVKSMPSVMLSYAMEKMDGQERTYWRTRRKGKIDG